MANAGQGLDVSFPAKPDSMPPSTITEPRNPENLRKSFIP